MRNIWIDNYQFQVSFVKCRPDGYDGVAILIKKGINLVQIPFKPLADIVVFRSNIMIVYFPPNIPIQYFKNEVERVSTFLVAFFDVVLAGDFSSMVCPLVFVIRSQKARVRPYEIFKKCAPTFLHAVGSPSISSSWDLIFSNSAHFVSQWKIVKDAYVGNSRHVQSNAWLRFKA